MPCLTDVVADLKEQVTRLTNGQPYSGGDCSAPSRPFSQTSTTSSSASTPSRLSSGSSTPIQSDSDIETELVRI
jgi:hypothetical protein